MIRVRVNLNDPEMIDIRLGGNPLHVVRLDVFNRDHILSPVLKIANNDEFAEWTGSRLHRSLSILRRDRRSLWNYRITSRYWIGSVLIRILRNDSLWPRHSRGNITVIDVSRISSGIRLYPRIRWTRVSRVNHDHHRILRDSSVA